MSAGERDTAATRATARYLLWMQSLRKMLRSDRCVCGEPHHAGWMVCVDAEVDRLAVSS